MTAKTIKTMTTLVLPSPVFSCSVYKSKLGGRRFADLLARVSDVDSEMRVRFTSPHPKDFPGELLDLINERPNVCNYIHLPAQSGSDQVLRDMRRGYTREAYLRLVDDIKTRIPDVRLVPNMKHRPPPLGPTIGKIFSQADILICVGK